MYNIREASMDDLPDILDLYRQFDMDNGNTLELNKAAAIFKKMKSYPDYKIYVAEDENVIVGTFALAIMDNIAHLGSPSGLVEDVVVSAKMQGKGIGKKMMETAMDLCRSKGCYKLALSSKLKRVNAHRFYESIGFEKHGYSYLVESKKDN